MLLIQKWWRVTNSVQVEERMANLLGLSRGSALIDPREIDWRNAKLIGNGAVHYSERLAPT